MKFGLILLGLILASEAQASVEASTQIRSYDDGETQVLSPAVDIDTTFNRDRMKFGVGATTDVLTSASSDVRTFSSKGKITDDRKEFTGDFEAAVEDGTIGIGYVQSDEKDYHSKIFSASGSKEFFQKNTVFRFGFANGQDRVEDTTDPDFSEPMNHQNYSLSVEQVVNKRSLMQVIYDLRIESGFVQSPYRRAKVKDVDGLIQPSLKYNYFIERLRLALASTYRFYMDSWEVRSHTFEERLTRDIGNSFSLSFILRFYAQSSASFFKDYYLDTESAPFRTGNSTLSEHDAILLGIRPVWKLSDNWSIYGKFELYQQNFKAVSDAGNYFDPDDDKMLKTDAKIIGAGMTIKF